MTGVLKFLKADSSKLCLCTSSIHSFVNVIIVSTVMYLVFLVRDKYRCQKVLEMSCLISRGFKPKEGGEMSTFQTTTLIVVITY